VSICLLLAVLAAVVPAIADTATANGVLAQERVVNLPNDQGKWAEQPDFAEPPLSIEGAADHWNHREDTDYYSQPGALFRLMSAAQQKVLFENTARSVGGAPREIQIRHIKNCLKADKACGKGVADALGIPMSEVG